jgi:RND family efflux transporter MFP subunit
MYNSKMRLINFIFFIVLLIQAGFAKSDEIIKELKFTPGQQLAMGINYFSLKESSLNSILVNGKITVPLNKQVILSMPYSGQMDRPLKIIGDKVKKNDNLAYLTIPQLGELKRELAEFKIELRLTKEAYARDEELFKNGIISNVRLNLTKSKIEVAQSKVDSREAELKSTNVESIKSLSYASGILKSPMGGVIVESTDQIGKKLEVGTILFKITDTSELLMESNLASYKAQSINTGDDVIISSKNAKGKVIAITKSVDANQFSKLTAKITESGSLQMGEILSGIVYVKNDSSEKQWQIPTRSIINWKGQSAVFVKTPKGANLVPIKLVSSDDDNALINGQFDTSSQVVVTGTASLKAFAQKTE